jgi:hypothetical protein
MQGRNLFEYAVVRYVPRPEREEFLNVGVILFCPSRKFAQARFSLPESKIKAFYSDVNMDELRKYLQAFEAICCGGAVESPIAKLDPASRFRWLTATRSTIIQTSKVHPGFCDDPVEKLEKLREQLVES